MNAFRIDYAQDCKNYDAGRCQRVVNPQTDGAEVCDMLFSTFAPEWSFACIAAELQKACGEDHDLLRKASGFMLPRAIDFVGMHKAGHFVGREYLSLPFMRMQMTGFRVTILFKIDEAPQYFAMRRGGGTEEVAVAGGTT